MFFHSWGAIGRVVAVAAVFFVVVVLMLRVVGQQALAKMSGYDVVLTVTLGSIIATVVLAHDIAISEAVAALLTLTALQELTRWLQSRFLIAHHAVREAPRVVLWDGQLLEDRLRASSTSADELRAAVRKMGLSSFSQVQIIVLENDGEWSVVPKAAMQTDESALFGLAIPDVSRHAHGPKTSAVPASPHRVP